MSNYEAYRHEQKSNIFKEFGKICKNNCSIMKKYFSTLHGRIAKIHNKNEKQFIKEDTLE